MNTIYLKPADVPPQLRGAYAGQKFSAIVTPTVTIPASAGLWSDGSRETYTALDVATGRTVALSDNTSAPWDDRRDNTVTLQAGFIVRRHNMARGVDMGLTFYVHPDNAAKLLPAPTTELGPFELVVLKATASYKSSYGGRNRYQMAQEDQRYTSGTCYVAGPFPTPEQWETAKQTLIHYGLLNKAGAITPAGRNAARQPAPEPAALAIAAH